MKKPVLGWRAAGAATIFPALLLPIAGAAYQAIGNYHEARKWPEAGRLVDTGGLRLLLNCTGAGEPTVILESGLGDLSGEWKQVQDAIAARTRVCSYDRAGYGGSDPGPLPRTSRRIATELHGLLHNAGERPPFILVGHSFGGYNVRLYRAQYPTEAAAIVLVDSPQEDQYTLLPAGWKQAAVDLHTRYRRQAAWAPLLVNLGIARWMLRGSDGGLHLILQSKYLRARASELEAIEASAEQARAAGAMGGTPLIVLTAGMNSDPEFQRIWADDLQMRLVRLSTRGERIVVPDSGHDMPADRPDAIVDAVERAAAIP